jgi:hypothetical protein
LARLNAAITEGLKLQRVQEAAQAAGDEAAEAEQEKEAVLNEADHNAPADDTALSRPESSVEEAKSPLSTVAEEVKTIIDELIKNGGGGLKKSDSDSTSVIDAENGGDVVSISVAPRSTDAPTTIVTTAAVSSSTVRPTTTESFTDRTPAKVVTDITDKEVIAKDVAKDSVVVVGTTDNSAVGNRPTSSDHPSSHFRPSPAAAAANWTTAVEEEEFFPMPKSNLMPKDSSLGIMIANGGGLLPQKPLPKR